MWIKTIYWNNNIDKEGLIFYIYIISIFNIKFIISLNTLNEDLSTSSGWKEKGEGFMFILQVESHLLVKNILHGPASV